MNKEEYDPLKYWENEYNRIDYQPEFENEHLTNHGKLIVRSLIAAFARDLRRLIPQPASNETPVKEEEKS